MNKHLKKIIWAICLSLIAFVVYFAFNYYKTEKDKEKYLTYKVGNEEFQIEIPEEIVRSRDCAKFFEWQTDNLSPIIPRKKCPWMKYSANRDIEIDNLKFSIPRSFLIGSSRIEDDGVEKEGILLAFTYPEIEGGIGNGKDFVHFFIQSVQPYLKQERRTESDFLNNKYYHSFLHIYSPETKYSFVDKGYNKSLNMKHYIFKEDGDPEHAHKLIYVSGIPESPEEFVVCDFENGDRNFCKSAYFYKGFYITSNFQKKRIENYINIKTTFNEMLDKWEIKGLQNKTLSHEVVFDYKKHESAREIAYKYYSAIYNSYGNIEIKKSDIGIDLFDIDGDGELEILSYLNADGFCGSLGCSFKIFKKDKNTNEYLRIRWRGNEGNNIDLYVKDDITISEIKHNGFHDIIFNRDNFSNKGSIKTKWYWKDNFYMHE